MAMNRTTRRVLLGYMQMSDTERVEFDAEADRYRRGDFYQKKSIRESVRSSDQMDLGPAGSGCPCCGRG